MTRLFDHNVPGLALEGHIEAVRAVVDGSAGVLSRVADGGAAAHDRGVDAVPGLLRAPDRPTQPDATGRPSRVTVPEIDCGTIAGVEPACFFFIFATTPVTVFSSVTFGV